MTAIPLSPEFQAACNEFVEIVKNNSLTNDEKSKAYGYYKQGSTGDNISVLPSIRDKENIAKWEAHQYLRGINPPDAQELFVLFVAKMKAKYSTPLLFSSYNQPTAPTPSLFGSNPSGFGASNYNATSSLNYPTPAQPNPGSLFGGYQQPQPQQPDPQQQQQQQQETLAQQQHHQQMPQQQMMQQ